MTIQQLENTPDRVTIKGESDTLTVLADLTQSHQILDVDTGKEGLRLITQLGENGQLIITINHNETNYYVGTLPTLLDQLQAISALKVFFNR